MGVLIMPASAQAAQEVKVGKQPSSALKSVMFSSARWAMT